MTINTLPIVNQEEQLRQMRAALYRAHYYEQMRCFEIADAFGFRAANKLAIVVNMNRGSREKEKR